MEAAGDKSSGLLLLKRKVKLIKKCWDRLIDTLCTMAAMMGIIVFMIFLMWILAAERVVEGKKVEYE
jgi:hypothetical protein